LSGGFVPASPTPGTTSWAASRPGPTATADPAMRAQAQQAINGNESEQGPGALPHAIADTAKGYFKGAGQSVDFLSDKVHQGLEAISPGLGEKIIPQSTIDRDKQFNTMKPGEQGGAAIENMQEIFRGEELLDMASKAMKGTEALKGAVDIDKVVKAHPFVARLLRIGMNTAKVATESGASTYVHSGGDADAAGKAALLGGAVGGGLSGAAEGVKAAMTPAEAEAGGAAKYAETAQAAIQPHMEDLHEAAGKLADFNVNDELAKSGDYITANETLQRQLNAVGTGLDKATDGRYTELRQEVTEARNAAYRGGDAEEALYDNKTKEMVDLLDKANVDPKLRSAVQSGWTRSYALDKFATSFDRSLDGIPGGSQASQAQKGINGKVLMTQLKNATIRAGGRDAMNSALGGPDRLETLEEIAKQNITAAQRTAFNRGVRYIATRLPAAAGAGVGYKIGGWVGAGLGAEAGAKAGNMAIDATAAATARVFKAVSVNPTIARNVLFALESGARPERYGPFIATMIQKYEQQQRPDGEQQQQTQQEGSDEK
jgi:hypothetical protein